MKMAKNLSKNEYELMSELALRRVKSITLSEASTLFNISRENLKIIFHRLEKKRWLERIERGKYLVVPLEGKYGWSEHPFLAVSRMVKEYYISYRTALAHYGLTEQLPHYVYVATLDRKNKREKEFQNYVFRFIKINKRKFFGFKTEKIEGEETRVAEIEKAIVDCLDNERYAGTIIETAKSLSSSRVNINKAKIYAIRMKNASLVRRLGYLLDTLNLDSSGLENGIGRHRAVYLSTTLPKQVIEMSLKWKLIVNIKKGDLLEW